MTTQVEIETKYDVADGQPLPRLVGVAGVASVVVQDTMVLTATYVDTLDHVLAAAAATLRRRTGGSDDGWHLKLSLERGERLELHRDLAGDTPPPDLTALMRAVVGDRPLQPVARLTTRRTVHLLLAADGRSLAELADDHVIGERLDVRRPEVSWREVEIELVDGDLEVLAALDAAVRAGGVHPSASASKLGRVLDVPRLVASPARDLLSADPLVRLRRPGAPARLRSAVCALDDETPALGLGWLDDALTRPDDALPGWQDVDVLIDSPRYLDVVQHAVDLARSAHPVDRAS